MTLRPAVQIAALSSPRPVSSRRTSRRRCTWTTGTQIMSGRGQQQPTTLCTPGLGRYAFDEDVGR